MAPLEPPPFKPPPFKPPPFKTPTFQTFESENGEPLPQTIAYPCLERGRQYILWKDVQREFQGVDHLKYARGLNSRALYMVDHDGEFLQPLRIKCDLVYPYQVVYRHHQGHQKPGLEFEHLYHTWMEVFKDMEQKISANGFPQIVVNDFQEMAANVRYHYSKVLDQLAVLNGIEEQAEADGKTEDHILTEFKEYQQKMASWEYAVSCIHILQKSSDYPVPCLFVVLPSDLGSWDDSDPTTHNFRLHFLCDIHVDKHTKSTLPKHKHLSSHPGYDLVRPHEFFQKYGSYTLTILKMVRQGHSHLYHEIPSLGTFEILWDCDHNGSSTLPTKDTIGPLVNKAIRYLEELSTPRRSHVSLTQRESIAITDFLAVPDDSNTLGGLYRYTDMLNNQWFWYCKQHAHQWLTSGTLEGLVDFVLNCGGQVDTQLATLHVDLHSRSQMEQLWTLLNDTKPIFHGISIMLGWEDASRQDMDNILQKANAAGVHQLELSSIPYDTHLQGSVDYRTDIFASLLQKYVILKTVKLLNYPRPREQYAYFSIYGSSVLRLHFEQQQQVDIRHCWNDQRSKAADFVQTHEITELLKASQHLQDFFAQDGYQAVSTIGHHQNNWCGEFDLEKGTLRELQVYDLSAFDENTNRVHVKPVALEALVSLHTLTVDVDDLDTDQVVTRVMQASPQLQDLLISLQESHVLERVEKTLETWRDRSSSLRLTLLERDNSGRGHVVAQALIRGHANSYLESGNTDSQGSNTLSTGSHSWKKSVPTKVEFLQWNCDHVAAPLLDLIIAILDMATVWHPSVLTSFVLDISEFSDKGLSHVQNILQRSMLSHLQIRCTIFDPCLTDIVRQVLLVIQWSALHSLILSGAALNEWIQLLATTEVSLLDLQLQSFRIQGSGSQSVCLTHSSVLFVLQLIYSNPLMKVVLESVYLQDERDSDLVRESPLLSWKQGPLTL